MQKCCTATNSIASKLDEESLAEWMNVDKETPVVHHCNDSEIIP